MKNGAMSDFATTKLWATANATKTIAVLILMVAGAAWVAHAQSLTTFTLPRTATIHGMGNLQLTKAALSGLLLLWRKPSWRSKASLA